jgi:SAM-dependent methyltransferase
MRSMIDDAPPWLRALHDGGTSGDDPVSWNLAGLLRGWREWPESMDFLDPGSPNAAWKRLETALYADLWGDLLDGPPMDILDAACGSGRMLVPLAAAGHRVVGVDACRPSLEAAERHLEKQALSATLHWGDVRAHEGGPFDRILALELLSYLPDAPEAAQHLASLLRPGGRLIVTVEAWPGALLADPTGLTPHTLAEALQTRVLSEPGERWVRPSDLADLGAILRVAGFGVLLTAGTHYLPDGPLGGVVDLERLDEEGYTAAVIAAERSAREDPAVSALPRAWLAIATKR